MAGAIYATYLYLAKQIKWDWEIFSQGNTSQFLLPICLQKEYITSDVHDLVRFKNLTLENFYFLYVFFIFSQPFYNNDFSEI